MTRFELAADGLQNRCSPLSFTGMAERVGFEPTTLAGNSFQDRRHKPLGHLSFRKWAGIGGLSTEYLPYEGEHLGAVGERKTYCASPPGTLFISVVEARLPVILGVAGRTQSDALLEAVDQFLGAFGVLAYRLSIHRSHLSSRHSGLHT